MATLTITIADELAEQASALGLLEPCAISSLLREGIRRRHIDDLYEAADRLANVDLAPMSDDEIQAEIKAVRAEPRAA
jgi:post-segregation antitoxin (ccd killing protein)